MLIASNLAFGIEVTLNAIIIFFRRKGAGECQYIGACIFGRDTSL